MFRHRSVSFIIFCCICLFTLAISIVRTPAAGGNTADDSAVNSPVRGRPFPISTGSIDEVTPAVAYNSAAGEYLVVWNNQRAGTNDIYAQRVSEQGILLSWFYVADGDNPAVAYNPKNDTYLVVYERYEATDFDIYGRRVDFTGPLGPEFPIAFNLSEDESAPAVAANTHPAHDAFLVVWENYIAQPTPQFVVQGQRVAGSAGGGDGGGETMGGRLEIAVDMDIHAAPDAAYNLNMNEYLVVYTTQPGGGGAADVYGRRITANGVLLAETPIDSSGNDQLNPAVAAYRLNQTTPYLVVFSDYWNDSAGDVRGYLLNQQGQPMTLINIAVSSGLREVEPDIAAGETWGGYSVAWTQGPVGDGDIYARLLSDTGQGAPARLLSPEDAVPLGCVRKEVGISAGDISALAVWTDSCGAAGGDDIYGRLLGYHLFLPMVNR